MPVSEIRPIAPDAYLGLWNISETPEQLAQLLGNLKPTELPVPAFNNEGRQKQWLASRILVYVLLEKLTSAKPLLISAENGKPILLDTTYKISLSHTITTVAVLISATSEVGIDIENIHPKVIRVQRKFLSETELADAGDQVEKNLIYWCAKEALYKLYGRGLVLFKEHLAVQPFPLKPSGILQAAVNTLSFFKKYTLHYEQTPNFILVYCLDAQPENN